MANPFPSRSWRALMVCKVTAGLLPPTGQPLCEPPQHSSPLHQAYSNTGNQSRAERNASDSAKLRTAAMACYWIPPTAFCANLTLSMLRQSQNRAKGNNYVVGAPRKGSILLGSEALW
eukprot:585705-Amphidinium_carterae.1